MSNEDVAVALEGHGHEIGSLKHRVSAVEKNQEALNKLVSAVEIMAAETIQKDVTALGAKVDATEVKPAKK